MRPSARFPVAVATGGRTFLTARLTSTSGRDRWAYQVVRVSDGHRIGRTLTTGPNPARVQAMTPSRVLLTDIVRIPGSQRSQARTLWWTPRTGRAVVVGRVARPTTGRKPDASAASLRGHTLSVAGGRRTTVVDSHNPAKRLWTTGPDEAVLEFSPDGRRVLTVAKSATVDEGDPDLVTRIAVRNARTGGPGVVFTGYVRYLGFEPAPRSSGSPTPRSWPSATTPSPRTRRATDRSPTPSSSAAPSPPRRAAGSRGSP